MNKQTLAALIAGAEKWERNALAKTPDDAHITGDSCELCKLFTKSGCVGCPVMAKSGQDGCTGTPWERASDALGDWDGFGQWMGGKHNRNARARFRRAAAAEAKFLRSLIPAEGATE